MKKLLFVLSVGALLILPGCVCDEMCEGDNLKAPSHGLHKKHLRDSREHHAKAAPKKRPLQANKANHKAKPKKNKGKKHAYSDELLERAPWADDKELVADERA